MPCRHLGIFSFSAVEASPSSWQSFFLMMGQYLLHCLQRTQVQKMRMIGILWRHISVQSTSYKRPRVFEFINYRYKKTFFFPRHVLSEKRLSLSYRLYKHWTEKHLFYQYSAEKSLAVRIRNNGSYLIYLIHVHALYRRKLTFFLKSEIKLYFTDLRQKLVFLS